jgi:hypothetical protein
MVTAGAATRPVRRVDRGERGRRAGHRRIHQRQHVHTGLHQPRRADLVRAGHPRPRSQPRRGDRPERPDRNSIVVPARDISSTSSEPADRADPQTCFRVACGPTPIRRPIWMSCPVPDLALPRLPLAGVAEAPRRRFEAPEALGSERERPSGARGGVDRRQTRARSRVVATRRRSSTPPIVGQGQSAPRAERRVQANPASIMRLLGPVAASHQ